MYNVIHDSRGAISNLNRHRVAHLRQPIKRKPIKPKRKKYFAVLRRNSISVKQGETRNSEGINWANDRRYFPIPVSHIDPALCRLSGDTI